MADSTAGDDSIDETLEGSFPASDPPEWTGVHAGPPGGERGARVPPEAPLGLKSVRISLPVDEAVARIEGALQAAGVKVFARVDHAAAARDVGLSMPPTVVVLFGNPKGGTPLMVAKPTVAINLPMKALVWQDAEGATWLSYNTPALLVKRHGLDEGLANKLAPLGDLLEKAVRA